MIEDVLEGFFHCIIEVLRNIFVEILLRIIMIIIFNIGLVFLLIVTIGHFPKQHDVEAHASYIYSTGLLYPFCVWGVIVFIDTVIMKGL